MNLAWWRGRWRWLVAALFGATVVGAFLARYQGLVFPVRIASGSMAMCLLGPHRELTCNDCGFSFACDAQAIVPLNQATCPNCGFPCIELHDVQLRPGQRVLIDRWAYWNREPARGDVVAFVDPQAPTQLAVKRIAGLPGETIAIRGGELLINGKLYRKTLEQARATAVLVHDDTFRPTRDATLPSRWQGSREGTGWRPIDEGYVYEPHRAQPEADWLTYHHWRCYAAPHPRAEPTPVADNDGYNQGLSRTLHEVTDLWLSCQVNSTYGGGWSLRVHDGREVFRVQISPPRGAAVLLRGDTEVATSRFEPHPDDTMHSVHFGLLDEQVFLLLDERVVLWHACETATLPREPTATPLGIAATDTMTVKRLQVHRDIYYLNPHRAAAEWTTADPLPSGEYLLLGDNIPLSTDSRHWPRHGLARSAFIGRVETSRFDK